MRIKVIRLQNKSKQIQSISKNLEFEHAQARIEAVKQYSLEKISYMRDQNKGKDKNQGVLQKRPNNMEKYVLKNF